MYIPKHTAMPDRDQQLAFMRANSFATVVSLVDGALFATHVPVRTDARENGAVVLSFHLARANPQAAALRDAPDALCVFNGPHAYISPSNYEQTDVPTWNYVAVHASGRARAIDLSDGKLEHLADLIGHYEAAFKHEWDAMDPAYRAGMLNGIIAFEIAVSTLEGKAKLSQNRSHGDQTRVADWLEGHAHETPRAVGRLMRKRLG